MVLYVSTILRKGYIRLDKVLQGSSSFYKVQQDTTLFYEVLLGYMYKFLRESTRLYHYVRFYMVLHGSTSFYMV